MEERHTDPRIRPIEIRRDLPAIADLIETAFAEQMDDEGRDYLRHIRQIAKGVGAFILDGNTPESSQLPFHGYLWEEDGRIIGNLTLIPVRKRDLKTYFIANVAVSPEQRGKGIARKLTERAIAHVREHEGRYIYLQLRADNPPAIHIYQQSGFEEFARRTSWIFPKNYIHHATTLSGVTVRARKRADWAQQKEWLQQTYPPEIAWNLPYNLQRLRPDLWIWLENLMGAVVCRTWSAQERGHLIGCASYESGISGSDYLWLASSPAWEESAIQALLPHIHARVLKPQRIVVNYPAGRGVNGFSACGMTELHTLIWKTKEMSSRWNGWGS